MTLPLITQPTKTACAGRFENAGNLDVLQFLNADGSVRFHMNADGVIDPPVYPQIVKTIITAAQLNNLHAVPAVVVPAPGAGLYLWPISVMVQYNFNTVPFTVTGADTFMYIDWGGQTPSAARSPMLIANTAFVNQSSSQVYPTSSGAGGETPLSQVLNQPLVLSILDSLSNGNGTMNCTITYTVLAP